MVSAQKARVNPSPGPREGRHHLLWEGELWSPRLSPQCRWQKGDGGSPSKWESSGFGRSHGVWKRPPPPAPTESLSWRELRGMLGEAGRLSLWALRRSSILRNVKTGQAGAEASGTLPYPREGSVNLTFEILVTESWALA